MRDIARLYLTAIITVGLAMAIACLTNWHTSNLGQFVGYLALAAIASTRKVKLPGITGTYSLSFLFILLGITSLSFPETIIIGCVSALVQSVWNPRVRPKVIQVLFNIGSMVVSIAVSYSIADLVAQPPSHGTSLIRLAFAASLFFISNTFLVSGAISMADSQPFHKVWSQWIFWSVPYYLTGTAVALLMNMSNQQLGWKVSLFCLPLMYLAYLCYQLYMQRQSQRTPEPSV
jgi:hypothetical protein